jgi:putative iron-only hydrogenase system regulator
MEKRIGSIAIIVFNKNSVSQLNSLLSEYSEIILGRLGLPLKDRKISVISLIVEGDTDTIGALTGKIGKLNGVQVKSMLAKHKEEIHDENTIH